MDSAAARCLAITELVETVIDFACTGSVYQVESTLTALRRVNRLWLEIAEKRIVKTVILCIDKYLSRYTAFNASRMFQRSPKLRDFVVEGLVVDSDPLKALQGLSQFANLSSIRLEGRSNITALARCCLPAVTQVPRLKRVAIVVRDGCECLKAQEVASLRSISSLEHLSVEQYSWSACQSRPLALYHLINLVDGWVGKLKSLSISFQCSTVNLDNYLTGFFSHFTSLVSIAVTFPARMQLGDALATLPRTVEILTFTAGNKQIRYLLLELANCEILPNLNSFPKLVSQAGAERQWSDCGCSDCSITEAGPRQPITRGIVDGALKGLRERAGLKHFDAARAKYLESYIEDS